MSRENAGAKNFMVPCSGDVDQEMVPYSAANPAPVTTVPSAGGVALTPKFAIIQAALLGDNAIVAAVAGKKIRVLGYNLMASGAVNAKFRSNANDRTGLKYLAANGGISVSESILGWFETAAGEILNLNLSAAVPVGGELVYVEV